MTPVATERDALLAAIYDAPADDAPREVYADWLMEREHPRGELIMLEMKKRRSAEESERLTALQAIPGLFGPLASLTDSDSARERGLYRAIKLRYNANTLSWRAGATSPLAALIEEIDLETHLPTPEDFATFAAAAPRLRKVGMSREAIALVDPDHAKHWKVVGTGQSQHVVRL